MIDGSRHVRVTWDRNFAILTASVPVTSIPAFQFLFRLLSW
jgi:hypothetical protein